jgi:hypothetical protein
MVRFMDPVLVCVGLPALSTLVCSASMRTTRWRNSHIGTGQKQGKPIRLEKTTNPTSARLYSFQEVISCEVEW